VSNICNANIALSGEIQMDFKSDRLSDFMVYRLSDKTRKYEEYMRIPLSKAASNITDCMPWMVRCTFQLFLWTFCNHLKITVSSDT